jgi:hypothetical protein
MTAKKRLYISQEAVGAIRSALAAARCERCGVDKEHQQAMELYLRTWVVSPLERALDLIEGRRAAKRL